MKTPRSRIPDDSVRSLDELFTKPISQSEIEFIEPNFDSEDPHSSCVILYENRRDVSYFPTLSGFRIEKILGRGGSGIVYQAIQTDLARPVAIKMLQITGHESRDISRLQSEAHAIAQLQHPGIVQIHSVGTYRGLPYLVMEFVSGGDLGSVLRKQQLPHTESARICRDVARAVHYAHQSGFVHRDLKPANVLLHVETSKKHESISESTRSSFDSFLITFSPKITDFGLVKKLEEESAQTGSGEAVGTPSYMAPEQAIGNNPEIGPATDVYAIGAILYECLTGRPPYRAISAAATLMQVIGGDAIPPRRLDQQIPVELESICMKCLSINTKDRYHSADALAQDLHRYLKGEMVKARPLSKWGRAKRWYRKNTLVSNLSVALLGFLLIGFIASSYLWLRAEKMLHHRDSIASLSKKVERGQIFREMRLWPQARHEFQSAIHEYKALLHHDPTNAALLTGHAECQEGLARIETLENQSTTLEPEAPAKNQNPTR